ncbi:uncharacterized protein LOC110449491 isoform X1 [Mizuhopecten yessoensis]|uniref:uncharacterized protein LOC110449491 isoform X1 n=1 Tax=Mizuhopecten yessoensis TaxID=6573 RepID=UPI000B45D02B|nr:uncharacterized protein LOC110449491 isoform X1 [Mizuhopecten yessoensis]
MLGQNLLNVSSPSQSKLHNTGTKQVLLALMPDYAANYVPRHLGEEYPSILSDLFREECSNMNRGDLLDHCKELFLTITVSDLQATNVESTTHLQTGCKQWFRFRTGRVTASKMKSVCATSVDKPSPSLVKQICFPSQAKFSTDATRWGCQHEAKALDTYCQSMNLFHDNFTCRKSGLVINPKYPYIGASPDSVVSCDCCGEGFVEVKCPYCVRSMPITEATDIKASCLESIDGSVRLKKKHSYYSQVQTQIFVCDKQYCDFVVWTEQEVHIERIEPDEEF